MTRVAASLAAAVVIGAAALRFLPAPAGAAVAAAAALVCAGLLLRGMFSVRSSLVHRTIWRSDDVRETRVALSFDDGPHPQWTADVLDVLRRRNVRATFFVIGENARRYPDVLRRIHREGHEIGCHGDSHAWTTPFFTRRRIEAELVRCREAVRYATGLTPRLYRAPLGIRGPGHADIARRNDVTVVGMARRGGDGAASGDPAWFARQFSARAQGGEILALHDGEEPRHPVSRARTVAALDHVLDGLEAKGLRPVPVSTLIVERPYVETLARGWSGRSHGGRTGMAIFAGVARAFGHRGCLALAPLVAAWFVVAHADSRRASVAFRRRLHGPASAPVETWWAFRHFLVFGRTIIDRMTYLHARAGPPDVEVTGRAAVFETVASPGGCLLVSGHVGDWIAASRVTRIGSGPMTVVASRGMGVGAHQVLRDGGSDLFAVIDVDSDPVVVGSEIVAALRGGPVAMLGDRKVSADVVVLPFLGSDAAFPAGPWAVAMVTGAPVVVFFMLRMPGGRHRLELFGPIRVPKAARAQRAAVIRAGAAEFARHLEDVVRRHPLHWSNFYDFWAVR